MKPQFKIGDKVKIGPYHQMEATILEVLIKPEEAEEFRIQYKCIAEDGEQGTAFEVDLIPIHPDNFHRINIGSNATARVAKDCTQEVIENLKAVAKHIEENPDSINFY